MIDVDWAAGGYVGCHELVQLDVWTYFGALSIQGGGGVTLLVMEEGSSRPKVSWSLNHEKLQQVSVVCCVKEVQSLKTQSEKPIHFVSFKWFENCTRLRSQAEVTNVQRKTAHCQESNILCGFHRQTPA